MPPMSGNWKSTSKGSLLKLCHFFIKIMTMPMTLPQNKKVHIKCNKFERINILSLKYQRVVNKTPWLRLDEMPNYIINSAIVQHLLDLPQNTHRCTFLIHSSILQFTK